MKGVAHEGLLFQWEAPQRRKLAILGFIAASVAAHAFCFYLFQIVYPPTVSLLPPPGRVSLISSDTPEGRTLLRWIEAEDPALTFTTQRSSAARDFILPKLGHVPSYLTTHPILKSLPPMPAEWQPVTAWPLSGVESPRARPAAKPIPVPTAITFSHDFDSLGKVFQPALKFTAATRETPQSARFRLAVAGSGAVQYCFLESSSGEGALDEEARHYLLLCRFARGPGTPSPNQLQWGVATVEWGNDLSMPPPSSVGKVLP